MDKKEIFLVLANLLFSQISHNLFQEKYPFQKDSNLGVQRNFSGDLGQPKWIFEDNRVWPLQFRNTLGTLFAGLFATGVLKHLAQIPIQEVFKKHFQYWHINNSVNK